MNILALVQALISHLITKKLNTGVADDTRTEAQKQQDYLHEERIFPGNSGPFSNQKIAASKYPLQNQNSTSECVPHALALALGIERERDGASFIALSPTFDYRLRLNYPAPGTAPSNGFNIFSTYGSPLLTTLPTPLYEYQANAAVLTAQMYLEADIYEGKEFYILNTPNDITAIANIAAQGHGVPITIFSTLQEWSQTYPQILNPKLTYAQAIVQHEVCVLPNSGFSENGKNYVTIQDSFPFGGMQIRYLSEDFISLRCYGAGYWDTVSILGGGPKPTYTFTKVLKWGSVGNEVKAMQQLLVSEGCLPADCVTGNFYGRTLAGVHAFQNKYASDILLPLNLNAPTDTWGSACIAKANQLCA